MLQLKDYQERSLGALKDYFGRCVNMRSKLAFMDQTQRPYHEVPEVEKIPYICLRIPTGGGKTVMACHALGIAAKEYLQVEQAVCLWLVPSNVILEQTYQSLRNLNHPYREAVESYFNTPISVLNLEEALFMQRDTIDSETVIIVSTLAALRVEDTDGRRIYESAGALQHHFDFLKPQLQSLLEKNGAGESPKSLANVLRLHRPVVVMDEAHNARTRLSFSVLKRFNPSCIIEFTATPEITHKPQNGLYASNVLHHVSAAELKLEEMIKLPIKLRTRSDWKEALADAIQTQKDLEELSKKEEKKTGEYIRPIVLLQAQSNSQIRETLTVDVVKKSLLEDFKIPEDQIAIATGETREIDDIDLSDKACKIRFIITVLALKEGWDCPFAYVLCTVSEIGTARSVEQILGRTLRLPNAKKKHYDDLNYAHAIATSQSFINTANSLENALIANGLHALEAKDFIVPEEPLKLFDEFDLFAGVTEILSEPPDLTRLDDNMINRVKFNETTNEIKVVGSITEKEKKALEKCVSKSEDKEAIEKLYKKSQEKFQAKQSPSKLGEKFDIPALCISRNGQIELFEENHFLEFEWDLSKLDETLSESELPSKFVSGRSGLVDVSDQGKIEINEIDELHEQLSLLSEERNWTVQSLTNWLDSNISHPDLTWEQASLFIFRVLNKLIDDRELTIESLARYKFRLKNAIKRKIDLHRKAQAKKSYQGVLFSNKKGDILVSADNVFNITEDQYAPGWYYEGSYNFKKPFFSRIGELEEKGEEFECACLIDSLPEVKYWVRNLSRRPSSFWLPTPSDRFYPDFLIMLNSGSVLVLEYKGTDRWSNDDSKEKRAIGELWAEKGGNKCLFLMPKGMDRNAIRSIVI